MSNRYVHIEENEDDTVSITMHLNDGCGDHLFFLPMNFEQMISLMSMTDQQTQDVQQHLILIPNEA